jgi:hypothetical protein
MLLLMSKFLVVKLVLAYSSSSSSKLQLLHRLHIRAVSNESINCE